MEFLADPEAGEVRILSGYHHAPNIVSAIVDRLSRRYPRIVFHVTCADSTDAMQQELYARKVDLLIARRWGSASDERLQFRFCLITRISWWRERKHPWPADARWGLLSWPAHRGCCRRGRVHQGARSGSLRPAASMILTWPYSPSSRKYGGSWQPAVSRYFHSVLTTFTVPDVKSTGQGKNGAGSIGIVTLKNAHSARWRSCSSSMRASRKPLATRVL